MSGLVSKDVFVNRSTGAVAVEHRSVSDSTEKELFIGDYDAYLDFERVKSHLAVNLSSIFAIFLQFDPLCKAGRIQSESLSTLV